MANGKRGRPRKHPKQEFFPFEPPEWLKNHPDYPAQLAATNQLAKNLLNTKRSLTLHGIGPAILQMWDDTDPELTDTPLTNEEARVKYAKDLQAANEKCEKLKQNQLRGAHTEKTIKDHWKYVEGVDEIVQKVIDERMTIRNAANLVGNKLKQAGIKLGQESLRKKLSQIKKNG